MNRRQEESNRACPDCRSAKKENKSSAVKTSKIIAGLLVMLGFAACEPDEIVDKPMYGPPEGKYMYGVSRAEFEQKYNVPDVNEAAETAELVITENEKSNENE